uniref:MSLNL protein n=1 Tax=Macrostomum lignano TaxID=282301 RepID=A0A1I8F5G9_9PLAT
ARVTELALLTADRADLLRRGGTDRLPRALNRLCLLFNPAARLSSGLASAAAAGCSATADAAKCLGSVLCSDSLPALRELQLRPGSPSPKARQAAGEVSACRQLYSQAFSGEEPPGSHSGLGDCEALLRLLLFRLPTACHCWRPRRRPSRPWRPPSCMSRTQRPPPPLRLLIDGGRG